MSYDKIGDGLVLWMRILLVLAAIGAAAIVAGIIAAMWAVLS